MDAAGIAESRLLGAHARGQLAGTDWVDGVSAAVAAAPGANATGAAVVRALL